MTGSILRVITVLYVGLYFDFDTDDGSVKLEEHGSLVA